MKQIFEILVPLALIIVLLMCMMNNNSEEYFSVGGDKHNHKKDGFKVGGPGHKTTCGDGFKVGGEAHGNSGNTCHVTMIWADWCGFSKKADPEFKSLKSEYDGKEVDVEFTGDTIGKTRTFYLIEPTLDDSGLITYDIAEDWYM